MPLVYRYIKEVYGGRRVVGSTDINLNRILQFTCGADEEPALAFTIQPEIKFVSSMGYFVLTANTCSNIVKSHV